MTIAKTYASGLYSPSRTADRLARMKAELDDLNRQLGSGKRTTTLAGLGVGRSTALSARAALSETAAYRSVIQRGQVRASLMSNALDAIASTGAAARKDGLAALATGAAIVPATAQTQARARLETVVGALNADFDGQYLFSGANAGERPVISVDDMLNGRDGQPGLTALIAQRRADDLGSGLGRLAATAAGGALTLAEETGPFGLKLAGVANGLGGATAALAGADPDRLSVTFAANPQAGETIDIAFTLPDGTEESLRLTARAPGASLGEGDFAIGADVSETAGNMLAALNAGLSGLARTKLAAASNIAAAETYFAGGDWYRGENGGGDARRTQLAAVDSDVTLGVGARANEDAFRQVLTGLAALTAGPTPGVEEFRALVSRSSGRADAMTQEGRDIVGDIGVAREAMARASERLSLKDAVLKDVLGAVEDASMEEVSTAILTLETRLQASYQVTAKIAELNLADYLR